MSDTIVGWSANAIPEKVVRKIVGEKYKEFEDMLDEEDEPNKCSFAYDDYDDDETVLKAYNAVITDFKEKTGISIKLRAILGDTESCPDGMEEYYWAATNAYTMNPDYVNLSKTYKFRMWSDFSAGS